MPFPKKLPFSYKSFLRPGYNLFEYRDVEFTEDFGIYKKGDKYDSVDIDYDAGKLNGFEGKDKVAWQAIEILLVPTIE
jgi:hypothetical protein